ncbi:fibronectin-like [Branchiostoma floridae x Branchiostoma belcheri]
MCGGTDNCVGNSTETVSCSPGIKCGAVGGLWHMNGDCGLLDVTGNGNDGTAQNTPLAEGPNGETDGSYLFQGTSTSYVDIPNNGHLDTQYSITILAHIFPTSTYGQVLIYTADDSLRLRLYQYDTTKVYMRTADRTGESTDYVGASGLTTNSWNYIGGSYNYSSGEISVWHDGVKVGSNWIEPTEIRTQHPIRLGVMDHYSYFSGRMSCLQIYGHAMTEEEVAAARGRCAAIRCPVLSAPNNGRMTGCNSFNQTVQFVCDAGFTLRGASDTICQANGTWSDEVPTCIAPPTGFTVEFRAQTYIVVTWQAPENQTTDSYTVQVTRVTEDNRDDCSLPTNGELRSNCTGLRSGVKYRFFITANIGSVSSEEVTIEERSFPPNPVEVSLVSGPDTITATWEIQNLHLSFWTSATAEITPPDGNDVVRVAAADSQPQLTAVFTSLVSGRTYTVGVQVIANTIASEVVNVTTTIAPNAPAVVEFAAGARSLTINWQTPAGDIGIYRLELSSGVDLYKEENILSQLSVSVVLTEPAAPKDVEVSAVTTSSIAVSWEAAEGDVEGYIVAITAIDECQVAENVTLSPADKMADMTGLDAGCRYRLMVMTFSGELKTHVSLEQSTKPESPRNFRVSFLGEFGIVVVWDPPSSGLFSQYIVSISPAHGTDPEVSLAPSDDRTVLFEVLIPNTDYNITLRVLSGNQEGEPLTISTQTSRN